MAVSTQSGSSSGFSTGTSSSAPVLNPGASGYYNQLLGLNQTNYRSVLDAYTGGLRNAQAQLPGIYNAYGGLQNQVMGTLGLNGHGWGVATPAAQAIQKTFEQQVGSNDQNLVNAGLGNTTVRSQLNSGAALQAGQAYGSLGAQLAQTAAGYQSQFGLAQQQARMQGLGLQTGLAGQLGSTLGGYQFRNDFGNLYGQASQSNNQSRNNSFNSGTSFSPSGGGGYGGGSNAGQPDPSQLPGNYYAPGQGNYLGGTPSGYYGTGGYGGGYTPAGDFQGFANYSGQYTNDLPDNSVGAGGDF